MIDELEKIKDLESLGMLRILLLLYHEKEMLTSKIQTSINISNDAYYKARNKLIDLKLIEQIHQKYTAIGPYVLTKEGMQIAEMLNKIIKIF